ncbi:fatty acid desaturase family protein [Noviherbaspirillum aerium]|uniref:fatty acid desaturase family protein n=1 Tax=Noviherbaspirillum aerium TaxID=2588497 RepID=UPI00124EBE23|nr:fatty acid desaturase family protein [Noviherbaspirillum aerium]
MHPSSVVPARSQMRLDHDLLKQLSRRAPGRLLLQTLLEWLCIAVLIATAIHAGHIAVSLLCMLLIATRQHALLILMHEYAHYQFSRRHAWLNDMLGDALAALPFFLTVHGFRRNHMPHHRHVKTGADSNWVSALEVARYQFPKTRAQTYAEMFKHVLGWYTLKELSHYAFDAGMSVNLPPAARRFRSVYALVVLALIACFDLWWTVLLYWIIPLATFLMGILYVRDVSEHFGMPSEGIAGARTMLSNRMGRLFICPYGINFHAEHHLYPSVPFHHLKSLHAALQKDDYYRRHAVITHGYLTGLVAQLAQARGEQKRPAPGAAAIHAASSCS